MQAISLEKIDQARHEIRQRKDERNTYVRAWRQNQKMEKRLSLFVQDYVQEKYQSIYAEAVSFYNTLNDRYPKKIDLRKTKEFRQWKKAKPSNRESSATTTTATTTTTSQAAQDPAVQQSNNSPLTIPQAEAAPQELEIGAELTVEAAPLQIDPQAITDQRIEEIIQELRNDPDLDAVFNDVEMHAEQEDEGIENDILW